MGDGSVRGRMAIFFEAEVVVFAYMSMCKFE